MQVTKSLALEVLPVGSPPDGGDALITASFAVPVIDEGQTATVNYSLANCASAVLDHNHGVITLDPAGGSVQVGPLFYTQAMHIEATDSNGGVSIQPLSIVVRRVLPALDPAAPVTITAVESGRWDDPDTWGGFVPGENDIASIPVGTSVLVEGRLAPVGRLKLAGRLDVWDGVLYVTDLEGASTAHLDLESLGGHALVILQNRPKHTSDTLDLWRGVRMAGGTVTARGRKPTHRARSVTAIAAGALHVDLDRDVTDWRVADKILFPSTYPPRSSSKDLPDWADDVAVIRKIEGRRVYFNEPLTYAHPGRVDPVSGALEEGPPVAHLMRDCGFITTDPTDVPNRGHVVFTGTAIDIESCMFHGTGRSSEADTIFMTPANQHLDRGRHPVALRNCINARLNHCVSLDTFPLVSLSQAFWGIAAIDCPGVSITDCVSFDWYGAGIFVEHRNHLEASGEIRGNVVCRIPGNKGRGDQNGGILGRSGVAVWSRTLVALTDNWFANTDLYGIETTGYGSEVSAPPVEWRDNEVIGSAYSFVQFAVSANYPQSHPNPERGVWGRLVAWNFLTRGLFAYPCKNVDVTDWIVRGVPVAWRMQDVNGLYLHDYLWEGGDVINCDVRGCTVGVVAPVMMGDAQDDPAARPFRVIGGTFANDKEFRVESAYSTTSVAIRPMRDISFSPASLPPHTRRTKEVEAIKGGSGRPNWAPTAPTTVTYVRPADGLTYRVYCAEQATDPTVWGEQAQAGAASAAWATGLVKAQ